MRTFHEWLEGHDGETVARSSSSGGELLSAPLAGEPEDESPPLCADDEATVDAVNRLVQQLFREDEVRHTSEVTGVGKHEAAAASSAQPRAGVPLGAVASDVDDLILPLDAPFTQPSSVSGGVARAQAVARQVAARTAAAGERPRPVKYELVPDDVALARAAQVAHGHSAGAALDCADESTGSALPSAEPFVTPLPDWTEDDPVLPPAFQQQAK